MCSIATTKKALIKMGAFFIQMRINLTQVQWLGNPRSTCGVDVKANTPGIFCVQRDY